MAERISSLRQYRRLLLDDLGNHTCADGTTAFADREAQTFFHRDRVDQIHRDADVVAASPFRFLPAIQPHRSRRRAEVELRTVALEERGMTAPSSLPARKSRL